MDQTEITLRSILSPMLEEKFPARGLQLFATQEPFAVFPPVHPEVGPLEIFDDSDEARVMLGHFTHAHFGCYDEGISKGAKLKIIAKNVCDFVDEVFRDKVQFYRSRWTGGYGPTGSQQGRLSRLLSGPTIFYVWSGPLNDGYYGLSP